MVLAEVSVAENTHFAAIKALVLSLPLYDYDRVPGLLDSTTGKPNPGQTPTAYGLLSVERRYVDPAVARAGRTSTTGWRVGVRVCAKSPNECREQVATLAEALTGETVTVTGVRSTPLWHDSSTAVESGSNYFSSLHQWTYAL